MVQVVHAILLIGHKYVLQLRDNKPEIPARGMWSLFGGTREKGESSKDTLLREINEELSISIDNYHFHWSFEHYSDFLGQQVHYTIYSSDITRQWADCRLKEGQKFQAFHFPELQSLNIPDFIRNNLERHYYLNSFTGDAD